MKSILNPFSYLAALALAVFALGCAGSLLNKENAAVAADFKVITPSTPEQAALLRKLPADKVTRIIHDGKPYYILPDLKNNQAYVGGPKQYHAYQQLRRTQEANARNPDADPDGPDANQMTESEATHWGEWSGWGAVGVLGGPGWY